MLKITTSLIGLMTLIPAFAQQTVTVTYTYSGLPLPIYSDSANTITVVPITVPRALRMSKVTAQVQLQYPNSGDLNLHLFSPQGTRTILLEHDCNVQNVDTTFDDAAGSVWKDFCPVEAGRGPFRSDQPLSNFNTDNSSFGVWQLAIENSRSEIRSGLVIAFSLTITGTTQLNPVTSSRTVVNAASPVDGGQIAPGEMVSIFGSGLGPVVPAAASSGTTLPTALGGTSVTINGTPAPIAYASNFRVDAQAPYSLPTTGSTTVQVIFNNQVSATIPLINTIAAPAVYTNGLAGTGPVQAVNQNGSLNSKLNPAPKGSTIAVYANGLGTVNPSVAAGAVPTNSPLSFVVGEVGAFIGGKPSTVQFAGPAPGFPGLYQVNIVVPTAVLAGSRELIIFSNGISTQKGVIVEVQ